MCVFYTNHTLYIYFFAFSHHAQYWAILADIFPKEHYDNLFENILPNLPHYYTTVSYEKGSEFLEYANAGRVKELWDFMYRVFGDWMATGEIVGIINSDDLLTESGVIGKVIDCFEGHKDIDCVYADLYYVSQYDTSKIVRHWITGKQRSFSKGWHPAHPTFYVKREIYSKYGLFDLDFKFAADFELMLRLVEKEHIRLFYLPEPLVRMRLGGTTSKNLTNIRKGNIECLNAFRKNGIPVSVLYPF